MLDPISKEDIDRLRQELSSLKPLDSQPQTLLESINRLQATMDKLLVLFENANKEIYEEYHTGMHDNSEKINTLIEQNEKIARGMVALADMLKNTKTASPVAQPAPQPVMQAQPVQPQPVAAFTFPATATSAPPPLPKPAQPEPLPFPAIQPSPAPQAIPVPVPPSPPEQRRKSLLEKFSFR